MNTMKVWRTASVVAMLLLLSNQAFAQAQIRVEGEIHDFTGPMEPPDPLGAWQIDGPWSVTLTTATGQLELVAALNMIRSDNVTRAAHTHHIRVVNPTVTPITGGFHLAGTATITSNGATAPFSGSQVEFDITGGSAVPFATVKLKFLGAAVAHFSDAALNGVVKQQ